MESLTLFLWVECDLRIFADKPTQQKKTQDWLNSIYLYFDFNHD